MAAAPADFADDEFLVSRELEEIAAASRRQHEPAHHFHAPFFSPRAPGAAVGCEVCGRGSGGINSPVSTAPLAASGGGGGSGLIAAPAPAWCLYCGCTQPLQAGQCSQCSPHRRAAQALQRPPASEQHRGLNRTGRGYYEAEDASRYPESIPGGARNRSGQYYSPPGTSYTIVETSQRASGARDVPLREIGFRPITTTTRASSQSPPASHARGRGAKHAHHNTAISPEQVIRMLGANHHPPGKHHARHDTHPPSHPPTHPSSHVPSQTALANLPVRTVSMLRPPDSPHGFGICVKGGRESGVGVYISRVEENSVAEHVGLRPGDTILEVNGMPFGGVSHDEALKMLKSCRRITMTVRSVNGGAPFPLPPPPNSIQSSAVPTSAGQGQLYTWTDRHGRPVSPPPEYAPSAGPPPLPPPQSVTSTGAATSAPRTWNYCSARSKDRTRKVELSIEPGQSLGLMIRGGIEYGLGVFVTGVDPGSVAERAGLMIGDQVLEVNGQSFLAVTHDEAVGQLKYHKRMSLVVRDVGKVPSSGAAPTHAASSLHGTWETHLPHTARSPAGWQRGVANDAASAALQMVQEKARVLLPHPEFASLDYYQREYTARQMDVEAFVAVLLEMLNTSEKYTLLTEIREVVRPEDRTRFDELVYRREAEGQRCRELRDLLGHRSTTAHLPACARDRAHVAHAPCPAATAGSPHRFALPPGEEKDVRTPSEDSGVDVAAHGCWGATQDITHSCWGHRSGCDSPPMTHHPPQHMHGSCWTHQQRTLRTSDLGLSTDETDQQDYRSSGERSRRHSSPGADQDGVEPGNNVGGGSGQYEDANMSGYLDGLRSSIGGLTQRVKSWYWGRPIELAQKLSRSFDMGGADGDQQALLDGEGSGGPPRRRQSMQRLAARGGGCGELPELAEDGMKLNMQSDETNDVCIAYFVSGVYFGAMVVPDLQGNLRITVKKSKPMLGIAIEGGANTKHPLPRIINIHENGAAYEAGGLEVGQLILEVDGQKVEGMHHQDVARLIAETFAARNRQEIEFLVVEAKKSNLEAKPTALIFLEA